VVCGEKPWGAAGGAAGTLSPSNLGSGAAACMLATATPIGSGSMRRTPEGQLWRGVAASLVVPDQAQDLAEARHGQQAAVLRVCDLPYLAQDGRGQLGALEELDGDLARDDAELLCVGLLEEVLEHALLVRRQVEHGLVCAALAVVSFRLAPLLRGCIAALGGWTHSAQRCPRDPPWLRGVGAVEQWSS
jgi:hypothetical protein